MDSQKVIIPTEAGIQTSLNLFKTLASLFRSTSCRSTSSGFWGDSRRESDRKSPFKVGKADRTE
jgi:hypothetical protein